MSKEKKLSAPEKLADLHATPGQEPLWTRESTEPTLEDARAVLREHLRKNREARSAPKE